MFRNCNTSKQYDRKTLNSKIVPPPGFTHDYNSIPINKSEEALTNCITSLKTALCPSTYGYSTLKPNENISKIIKEINNNPIFLDNLTLIIVREYP